MFPNINAECGRKGWTKKEFARQMGVSYGTIKNWLRGECEIPASKLIVMADLFGVSCDYLLGVGEKPIPPSN